MSIPEDEPGSTDIPEDSDMMIVADSGNPEIQRIQQLIENTPPGHPDLPKYYQLLGNTFRQEYQHSGNLQSLGAAVENYQVALSVMEEGHLDRLECLKNLAASFWDQYQKLNDTTDLEAALEKRQEIMDLTPEGHADRAQHLQSLAVVFRNRYQRLGDLGDLEASLNMKKKALDLTPDGHPARAARLRSLAASFTDRYHRLGALADLEAALDIEQDALNLVPEGHPDRPGYLQSLAASLTDRYHMLGDLNDLDAALQMDEEVVNLTPGEHPERAARLQGLALSLEGRYCVRGDLNDLEVALQLEQEAVNITPEGHPDKAQFQHNLAASFGNRYRVLGDLDDLQSAIHKFQEAVNLTPAGHPDKLDRLKSLAMSFGDRFKRLGDLRDLEMALQNGQEAVDLTPIGHPDRAGYLESLSDFLRDRYHRLGDIDDLESGLEMIQEAMDLMPEGKPERLQCVQGLAIFLRERYEVFGDLEDLEAALQNDQEVVNLTPNGHPSRANSLQSLASSFLRRYRQFGELNDLEAALQNDKEAVEITPVTHRARAERLQNLSTSLLYHYFRLGNPDDLEAVVNADEEALNLTPEGHPDKASCLQNRALSAINRYRKFREPEDAEAVHKNYIASFEATTLDPESSWKQALIWAAFAKEFQPSDCVPAYTEAFKLLPIILWVGLDRPLRQDVIHGLDVGGATSIATKTCIDLSQLTSAVEIMEQGLATEFQQILRLKTDVDGLDPEDAKNLRQLSAGIGTKSLSIVAQRNELLNKIRQEPALKNFLLPNPYDILCHASQGGPVVILNSHRDGCDGIIIPDPTSHPLHVPLPDVTLDALESQRNMLKQLLGHCNLRTRGESASSRLFGGPEQIISKPPQECFEDLLSWLWTYIVAPVYKVLKMHNIHNGRLWWLPTGAFTGLPLHASPPTDQFIHSYTATLGSLLEAYNKKPLNTVPKFGVVGVSYTGHSGTHPIKGVKDEVKKLLSIVPEPVQCLQDDQATSDAVQLQLQACSWVHLACHGKQDLLEPSKSRLLLYDGNLELETILQMVLSNAEFVFLAACQTAMGDANLVNESFHLGGGFIAAGFRSAVGTMWAMNDQDGPLITEMVYSHLFRDGRQPQATDAAEALQFAVKGLRSRKVPYERWIPFIHMGV